MYDGACAFRCWRWSVVRCGKRREMVAVDLESKFRRVRIRSTLNSYWPHLVGGATSMEDYFEGRPPALAPVVFQTKGVWCGLCGGEPLQPNPAQRVCCDLTDGFQRPGRWDLDAVGGGGIGGEALVVKASVYQAYEVSQVKAQAQRVPSRPRCSSIFVSGLAQGSRGSAISSHFA